MCLGPTAAQFFDRRRKSAADSKHPDAHARCALTAHKINLFSHCTHMSLPNDDLRLARAKVLHAQMMPESSNRILILRESSR